MCSRLLREEGGRARGYSRLLSLTSGLNWLEIIMSEDSPTFYLSLFFCHYLFCIFIINMLFIHSFYFAMIIDIWFQLKSVFLPFISLFSFSFTHSISSRILFLPFLVLHFYISIIFAHAFHFMIIT